MKKEGCGAGRGQDSRGAGTVYAKALRLVGAGYLQG